MKLELDTSRCTGLDCPKKHECLRYTDKTSGELFLSMFSPKSCIKKVESGDSVEFKYGLMINGE